MLQRLMCSDMSLGPLPIAAEGVLPLDGPWHEWPWLDDKLTGLKWWCGEEGMHSAGGAIKDDL